MKHFFLLLASVVIFSSCGPDIVYKKSCEIEEAGWTYQDSLQFEFDIQDTLTIYNLLLDIDHTREYPFQNLYMLIYTDFPSGERLQERVNIDLMDNQGRWRGRCGSENCHLEIVLQDNAFFNAIGPHRITLQQHMRENPLPGLKGFTFLLENTGQRRGEMNK